MRSAYLHIISDALGAIGAIVAGIVMYFFGWYVADPIISVVVSLLILRSAWGVVSNSFHILMEGTPITIDMDKVKQTLQSIEGVKDVHDLHIWTITSGLDSLSCHLLIDDTKDSQDILKQSIQRIEEEFHILHTTIQVEKSDLQHTDLRV
ncbi:cation diffusion facilitator family transporter [Anoxybacillus tepidamans]|uniref:Cobalt-zinc-cadmium resistance protein CzcD n=2 Tax=Anoxybacillaceae TaxID=3120669 RepID=A0A178T7U3_9BACL|nr:cation diffusion facilitator family transporter [Anoxybacillus tepidamans]OAO77022.1 Cobalt-zinc-cadmium resistance protein CzcD [Anoxybacillus flavithermus]OAO80751.1 Cobalt-zinc-cadmium resistance protein CzcD [Anoxybacillus flavithermus]